MEPKCSTEPILGSRVLYTLKKKNLLVVNGMLSTNADANADTCRFKRKIIR
jgi:hypothetical protein